MRQTTTSWKLLVYLKDNHEEWIPLKELKESNPLDVAEFATTRGIANEPEFYWWVLYTLRRHDKIIASVNSRVKILLYKYGIELPTSVKHAYSLDFQNKNILWCDAINREIENLKELLTFWMKGRNLHLTILKLVVI